MGIPTSDKEALFSTNSLFEVPENSGQSKPGIDPNLGFFRTFSTHQYEQLARNDDWRLVEKDFLPKYHSLRKKLTDPLSKLFAHHFDLLLSTESARRTRKVDRLMR